MQNTLPLQLYEVKLSKHFLRNEILIAIEDSLYKRNYYRIK